MDTTRSAETTIQQVLREGTVGSAYQPIVSLASAEIVAYEALARGPVGPLHTPDALFAAARAEGRLRELDEACRAAAVRGAVRQGLVSPLMLFVNVEPEALDSAPTAEIIRMTERASLDLRIVLEITERALVTRPAELLRTVDRVRELGWGLALDDVGAESASLAFMPLLRPDVIKLDLNLVQGRPGPAVAEIMNAVNAYAESSGAVLLAEGIEDERHVATALALGATLGQGWFFGRPGPGPAPARRTGELRLATRTPPRPAGPAVSPFSCLPPGTTLRRAPKRLLIEISKQLEREAMRLGETCIVASTFQEAWHFTPATRLRYRDLVDRVGFVCALGEGLPPEPVPGVRGAPLHPDDPVRGEWDVVVLAPHYAAALLARDLGDTGPEMARMFEYALTYRRETVVEAAGGLLSRVVPQHRGPMHPSVEVLPPAAPAGSTDPTAGAVTTARGPGAGAGPTAAVLDRALAASSSGITIVDVARPDQPLLFVNHAFEVMSGFAADQLVGRNCRFLQGPDTDPAVVSRIRSAIAGGRECRETLLNYRGPERAAWWNELYLAPVVDAGRVVQYIGVQNDVTERVLAERALQLERQRATDYLGRIEELAFTDPLTGLPNRRRIEERLEATLLEMDVAGDALAMLFLDLDRFKDVNDGLGHLVGDELLQVVGRRLRTRLRRSDLVARLGGDEFLVALPGLGRESAGDEARAKAAVLTAAVSEPMVLAGREVTIGVSIGISVYPDDATTFGDLLHRADVSMYAHKRGTEPGPSGVRRTFGT